MFQCLEYLPHAPLLERMSGLRAAPPRRKRRRSRFGAITAPSFRASCCADAAKSGLVARLRPLSCDARPELAQQWGYKRGVPLAQVPSSCLGGDVKTKMRALSVRACLAVSMIDRTSLHFDMLMVSMSSVALVGETVFWWLSITSRSSSALTSSCT